jgi:hypothetical protein
VGENPAGGYISYDNMAWAMLTSFQLLTADWWEGVYGPVLMSTGELSVVYFLFVIFLGSFFVLNLVLAVVEGAFEQTQKIEEKEIAEHEHEVEEKKATEMQEMLAATGSVSYTTDTTTAAAAGAAAASAAAIAASTMPEALAAAAKQKAIKYSAWRLKLQHAAETTSFVGVVVLLIVGNTLTLALWYPDLENTPQEAMLDNLNFFFTACFIGEALFKIVAYGPIPYFMYMPTEEDSPNRSTPAWNRFDFFVVVVSVIELIILVADAAGGSFLSILRTFRLLRVLKLGQNWSTMNKLITTLYDSVDELGYLTLIMVIVMYTFAALGLQLFHEDYTELSVEDTPRWNFKDFWHSFMLVFRVLCGEWIEPLHDSFNVSSWATAVIYYLVVLLIGNFIMINLFLSLLLGAFNKQQEQEAENDAANGGQEEEEEEVDPDSWGSKFRTMMGKTDKGKTGAGMKKSNSPNAITVQPVATPPPAPPPAGAVLTSLPPKAFSNKVAPAAAATAAATAEETAAAEEGALTIAVQRPPTRAGQKSTFSFKAPSSSEHSTEGTSEDLEVTDAFTESNPKAPRPSSFKKWGSIGGAAEIVQKQSVVAAKEAACCPPCISTPAVAEQSMSYLCCCLPERVDEVLWPLRRMVARFVLSSYFEALIQVLIIWSSLTLCWEDATFRENDSLQATMKVFNVLFVTCFTIEATLKIFGFGWYGYFNSGWNVLDFFIVIVGIVSLVVTGGNIKSLKALRTLRALRPLRAIQKWEGMKLVVDALLGSIPSIFNVMIVTFLIFLIFGIVGVQFFGGTYGRCLDFDGELMNATLVPDRDTCLLNNATMEWYTPDVNFDRIDHAIFALFQVGTFEGWMMVMEYGIDSSGYMQQPVYEGRYIMMLYFVIFIVIGSFFTLNLFIGVIIDNFQDRRRLALKAGKNQGLFVTKKQQAYLDKLRSGLTKKPDKQVNPPSSAFRFACWKMAGATWFEVTIMVVIGLNTIFFAITHYEQSAKVSQVLWVGNAVFTAVYVVEAFVKIVGHGMVYFKDSDGNVDAWNVFDFTIASSSVIALVLDLSVNLAVPWAPSTAGGVGGGIVGLLRILRVFRVFRFLRFAANIRRLVLTLIVSLPALINIFVVYILVIFIYSVVGMNMFKDVVQFADGSINDFENFSTFFKSMLMLFRLSTSAGWDEVSEACGLAEPNCDENYFGENDGNCGAKSVAQWYFGSLVIFIFLVVISAYIAVVLDNLSPEEPEGIEITPDTIADFYATWKNYDPNATSLLEYGRLTEFLEALPKPLGFSTGISPRVLAQLDIPTYTANEELKQALLKPVRSPSTMSSGGSPGKKATKIAGWRKVSKSFSRSSVHSDGNGVPTANISVANVSDETTDTGNVAMAPRQASSELPTPSLGAGVGAPPRRIVSSTHGGLDGEPQSHRRTSVASSISSSSTGQEDWTRLRQGSITTPRRQDSNPDGALSRGWARRANKSVMMQSLNETEKVHCADVLEKLIQDKSGIGPSATESDNDARSKSSKADALQLGRTAIFQRFPDYKLLGAPSSSSQQLYDKALAEGMIPEGSLHLQDPSVLEIAALRLAETTEDSAGDEAAVEAAMEAAILGSRSSAGSVSGSFTPAGSPVGKDGGEADTAATLLPALAITGV